ncbi:YeeE/YedE thiosulfate transporter family protein [Megalodesulfovibrio paquesii]
MDLVWGLVTGVLFGVLLQRCRVQRYDKQLGALRLKDMTIVKFMLTTVVVGAVGLHLLDLFGLVQFSIKSFNVGGVIGGGLLFGLGWGLCGYCPGTAAGALGEGRLDGLWAILGMLVGAGIFAELYPFFQRTILAWGDLGKLTLGQLLGTGPWPVVVLLAVGAGFLFRFFEGRRL